jgi:hypothetical protein
MIHRRVVSLLAVLLAAGAVACGSVPEPENETELNAQSSAFTEVIFTCKPPIATTIGLRCPQAGCCLQKSNFTSPPTYFCYDCR